MKSFSYNNNNNCFSYCIDIEDIGDLKRNGLYQKACTKFFNSTHSESFSNIVEHPNKYFQESLDKKGFLDVLKFNTLAFECGLEEEEDDV